MDIEALKRLQHSIPPGEWAKTKLCGEGDIILPDKDMLIWSYYDKDLKTSKHIHDYADIIEYIIKLHNEFPEILDFIQSASALCDSVSGLVDWVKKSGYRTDHSFWKETIHDLDKCRSFLSTPRQCTKTITSCRECFHCQYMETYHSFVCTENPRKGRLACLISDTSRIQSWCPLKPVKK